MSRTAPPKSRKKDSPAQTLSLSELEQLSTILAQTAEKTQPIWQEFLQKMDWHLGDLPLDPMNITRAYATFFQKLYQDPERLTELQMAYVKNWAALWSESTKRFLGERADTLYTPDPADRRFKSPLWQESALFDFIKQSYLMTSRWMAQVVHETKDLDPETRRKIEFYTKQFADAMSPTNFLMTNPDVIKETLDSKGENLIKGFKNLLDDLERGKGHLAISTTDYKAFEVGRNIATTPGHVVFQNDLIQLIQYEATTKDVFKTPLLIIPPWINKFYILDLRPENSWIKWLVDQGHSVFVISWVNPTPELAKKTFEDYIFEGLHAALKTVESETGEGQANVVGYCIGGTLLATALAWFAAKGVDSQIKSATFLTTLIDFHDPGDIKVFIDDETLDHLDRDMQQKGYLAGHSLKDAFSLLRANDLIWSFVVNNYLLGREPFPFDLLYWNDDSTNMPARMHSFYLRNMYRDNKLVQPGGITIAGVPIDVRKIVTPSYFLSTKDDHIAPWQSTYTATRLFSGPVRFTLSGSGHVAGVINPPSAQKYGYWTRADCPANPQDWFNGAEQNQGSWWTDWQEWIKLHAGDKIPARTIKKSLEPAPGSYVRRKAE